MMPDWLGAVLCIALVGWGLLGFWRGLSLDRNPQWGWVTTGAYFDPWGLLRYGRMYRGFIASSYDADGSRIDKDGKRV
jgi:hypothetical protein